MPDIQNSSRMSPTSYLRDHWIDSCEILWGHSWTIASISASKISTKPSGWVYRHSINPQFGPKTNPRQQRNNTPHHIIPLEGSPSNKLKEPHFTVKFLSECSILHCNHIHPRPYIHPCFQVINMTVIKILHRIGWFTRRNQNWVIVTLSGACTQTPSLITLPLKLDPGSHRHHKIVKNISSGV